MVNDARLTIGKGTIGFINPVVRLEFQTQARILMINNNALYSSDILRLLLWGVQ